MSMCPGLNGIWISIIGTALVTTGFVVVNQCSNDDGTRPSRHKSRPRTGRMTSGLELDPDGNFETSGDFLGQLGSSSNRHSLSGSLASGRASPRRNREGFVSSDSYGQNRRASGSKRRSETMERLKRHTNNNGSPTASHFHNASVGSDEMGAIHVSSEQSSDTNVPKRVETPRNPVRSPRRTSHSKPSLKGSRNTEKSTGKIGKSGPDLVSGSTHSARATTSTSPQIAKTSVVVPTQIAEEQKSTTVAPDSTGDLQSPQQKGNQKDALQKIPENGQDDKPVDKSTLVCQNCWEM